MANAETSTEDVTRHRSTFNPGTGEASRSDAVNHPSHYTFGKIEVIDAIEDWKLPYHLGNVVKYIARAGKKNASKTVEDLKKARWYLDRFIKQLESL